jgi:hypothetical protein
MSPRFGGRGPHKRKHTLVWLVAVATVLTVAPGWAQSTGGAPVAGRDSGVAAPRDSARIDSARTDSASAPGDTLSRRRPDSAAQPARPATPPPEPVDSALGAACEGIAGGRPDLLLVTFRPSATEDERSAVAQEVGGTLMGISQHAAPGSWYLLVPGSGVDPGIADRLILLPPVLEVGTTRCPS